MNAKNRSVRPAALPRRLLFPQVAICICLFLWNADEASAQIDPIKRNLVELGVDQPLEGEGPDGYYAYYYYNQPDFTRTNLALRLAVAPLYLDSELGFKGLISPTTDVGVGVAGGAFGDNYYEVRQGDFLQDESFYGHGGGATLSVYQLLDPGREIPLNLLVRGGFHFATYATSYKTAADFQLPQDQYDFRTRVGLRLAGKQPVLYPDLSMELSVWFERYWRLTADSYGFNDDRSVSPAVSTYWAYAEMSYAWTNTGQKASLSAMAADSSDADRFSAWRPGGVLPLISEFPLMIPGYFYQELTVQKLVNFYGSYEFPLDDVNRLKVRLEAATACCSYLPGFDQPNPWQSGVGAGLAFTTKNKHIEIVARYGYGFNAVRYGHEGSQDIGLLFQYNFQGRKDHGH